LLALLASALVLAACGTHEYEPTETVHGIDLSEAEFPDVLTAVDFLLWHPEENLAIIVSTIRELGADLDISTDTTHFPEVALVFDFTMREDAITTFEEDLLLSFENMPLLMMEAMQDFGVVYPAVRFTLNDTTGNEIKTISLGA